jgi:ankyrin repeat protein
VDLLLAACGRGDVDAARRLSSRDVIAALGPADSRLLPEAAAESRDSTVAAYVAAGFPVNATDATGATALHHCALHGRASAVRLLLEAGAATDIRDAEHSSTPLGWACFGADYAAHAAGDYADCVRALLEAGAHFMPDKHRSRHEGVLRVIEELRAG